MCRNSGYGSAPVPFDVRRRQDDAIQTKAGIREQRFELRGRAFDAARLARRHL